MKEPLVLPPARHLPSQYGLTMTPNGPLLATKTSASYYNNSGVTPALSTNNLHAVLNRQVVHNVFLPPMDRVGIQANFPVSATNDSPSSTNIEEDSRSNGFELNTEEHSLNEEEAISTNITINDRQKAPDEHMILSPSPQFLTEIELLNIILRHKLPLLTFQTILK